MKKEQDGKIHISRELLIECDENYVIKDISPNVFNILRVSEEFIIGKDIRDLVYNKECFYKIFSKNEYKNIKLILGGIVTLVNATGIKKEVQGKTTIYISMIEINEYAHIYKELKSLRNIIESSKDIVYYYEIEPEVRFKYISSSFEKVLGKDLIRISYENPWMIFERIHPDDFEALKNKVKGTGDYSKPMIQRWKNDEGEYIWFEDQTTPIFEGGKVVAIQGIMRNIDEKVKKYSELEYRINHDALTKVYSRQYFNNIFEKYDKKINTSIGIIMCDIDKLKYANDNFGHNFGDSLIEKSGEVLNRISSKDVIVSRIGGDEFAIININSSEKKLKKLVDNIDKEILRTSGDNDEIEVSLSKGYAYSSISLGNMKKLLAMADERMYKEKSCKNKAENTCFT